MDVEIFLNTLNSQFYTGVPDSQLKPICNYLIKTYGVDSKHHIIAANEGNALGIAAGYYLATKNIPVVYMQNSGEGNIINPLASLVNDNVYAIPIIFVIGWRGEPGVHDEPQHTYQGKVTLQLLKDTNVAYFVIDKSTSEKELENKMSEFLLLLSQGKQVAFVIRKGALTYNKTVNYKNPFNMIREDVLRHIVDCSKDDVIVSTTGKISRELFEIREENNSSHKYDFLTVGSMGHCSSIALGVAINKPNRRVWCIDGDGAVLMHMGAMAVIGATQLNNYIHIVINNGAHETVGGMPTVAKEIDLCGIAKACGYKHVSVVESYDELDRALTIIKNIKELSFLEIRCQVGARSDLGRPTITTFENKLNFMDFLDE